MEKLLKKIENKDITVGIIGFGYVGMPLGVEFAKNEVRVLAFEVDENKVKAVNSGKSYVIDVEGSVIKDLVKKGYLKATSKFSEVKNCDVIIICVPTPLRKSKDPDLSYIISAANQIKKYLRKNHIVILESTTYPGTTEEVLRPMLEESGLKCCRDFFLAFSPERVDPGNKKYGIKNTPKVVGGVDKKSSILARKVYSLCIDKVVEVSNTQTSEMVKLLENTFRAVNIAMINEMALMCKKINVDIWEVIEAAKTKPFGFMPFYPGPGIGGHCIPLDPHYLGWKMKMLNFEPRFIELAGAINSSMPQHVVNMLYQIMDKYGKTLSRSKIFVIGVAYKPDISDVRESPAIDVMTLLSDKVKKIDYYDPYVESVVVNSKKYVSVPLNKIKNYDCTLILTNHKCIDWNYVVKNSRIIFDTRNAVKVKNKKIYKL